MLSSRQGFGPKLSARLPRHAWLRHPSGTSDDMSSPPCAGPNHKSCRSALCHQVDTLSFAYDYFTYSYFLSFMAWPLHDVSDGMYVEALYTYHSGPDSFKGVDDAPSCLSSGNFFITAATVEAQEAAQGPARYQSERARKSCGLGTFCSNVRLPSPR